MKGGKRVEITLVNPLNDQSFHPRHPEPDVSHSGALGEQVHMHSECGRLVTSLDC